MSKKTDQRITELENLIRNQDSIHDGILEAHRQRINKNEEMGDRLKGLEEHSRRHITQNSINQDYFEAIAERLKMLEARTGVTAEGGEEKAEWQDCTDKDRCALLRECDQRVNDAETALKRIGLHLVSVMLCIYKSKHTVRALLEL